MHSIKKIFVTVVMTSVVSGVVANAAFADDDKSVLDSCKACHALEKSGASDVSRVWERKAPDLYYAGNKFQREWLVSWLQAPTRIRPGGEFYRKHIKSTAEGDVIDSASLSEHPRLDKDDAEAAATKLMALKTPNLVEEGGFQNAVVSEMMGAMFFGKLRGCAACHQDAPDHGGMSGPELYSAHKRLQADYVYSYIKHPQTIDPHVWMPDLGLTEVDLQRLTGYIMQLKGAETK